MIVTPLLAGSQPTLPVPISSPIRFGFTSFADGVIAFVAMMLSVVETRASERANRPAAPAVGWSRAVPA